MTTEVFGSVWDALEDTPTEAENMKLRSSLMIAISEAVSAWRVTQMEAARRLGVTQPRLNDLLRQPLCRRVPGHGKPQQLSSIVTHD